MEDTEKLRICKKCIIRDSETEEEFFKKLRAYIMKIPEEEKTSDEAYRKRLSICASCDMIINGMCRKCGCYVEYRAANDKNTCPDAKW